jgi:phosphoglycerate dehydrogenase-like enzyme
VTQVRVASSHRDEYVALLEDAGVSVVESAEVVLADPVLVNTLDLESARWIQSTWAGVDAIDWSQVPPDAVVTTLPGVFGHTDCRVRLRLSAWPHPASPRET